MAQIGSKNNIHFIGIGAQKAGTTWLHDRLSELSEFTLPYIKELHYFDRDQKYKAPSLLKHDLIVDRIQDKSWLKGAEENLRRCITENDLHKYNWLSNFYFSNYSDSWYPSLFKDFKGLRGEITPSYSMLDEEDVQRMHSVAPDAKIIFMIRNPIDRAWSHFRYFHKNKKNLDSIDEILDRKIIRFFERNSQDKRSDYIRTIDLDKKYYDKNFIVGFYDAIIEQPSILMKHVVDFIGGNSTRIDEECQLSSKSNTTPAVEIPAAAQNFLLEKYKPLVQELSDRMDGYPSKWLHEMLNESTDFKSKTNLDPVFIG